MSSKTSTKQQTPAVMPIQTRVRDIAHLPVGQRIITCSWDGSLRLWDLESGTQIGEDWKDGGKVGVYHIALSPDGKVIVSGSDDGKVKLWDVEMGKVIATWTGHTGCVTSVCWSADGNRVVSGSFDGTARVWNVKTGETILEIKTGHEYVWAVLYSPDNTEIAIGGYNTHAAKIWNAKTGNLITTLEHDWPVCSLAWTLDGEKLISASYGPIRIFDTVTWNQIATLEGHQGWVSAISLSRNNRLLASASDDKTARLWNLDTNLPVGSPLQHKGDVYRTALSPDGKVLITSCNGGNAYAWDIHAFLKTAGLEDLLSIDINTAPKDILEQKGFQGELGIQCTPRSSLSDKSFLEADATRCHDEFGGVDELSPRFFDGMEADDDSSPTGGPVIALLARLASLLHRFRSDNAEANGHSQLRTLSGFHPRVLFARLLSLIHLSPPENDAPNELQQPSMPSRLDLHALLARLHSLFPRSQLNTEDTEPPTVTPSGSRPDAVMDLLFSFFRSQPHTNEDIELSQCTTRLHVADVAPMRDREVLFVAPRMHADHLHHQSAGAATPGAGPAHSRPIRLLGHIGLFLCCMCNHQHPDDSAQPTQQQRGQS